MVTFAQTMERNPKRLLVVDAFNLAFRWKHQKAITFVDDYIATIFSLANSYDCGRIFICADKGSSEYRRELYPEYKANRDYSEQTEQEKAYFKLFIEEYEKCLEALQSRGIEVLRFQGVEADDIAAAICGVAPKGIEHIWLISSDKDWDLLICGYVSRFSYVTRKEVTSENFEDTYGLPIENYIDLKVLQGDMGDNIPGIPQVGPVRAKDLIQQYGSAWGVYDATPIPGSAKYIKNVNEQAERIPLNYQLMDLREFWSEAISPTDLDHIIYVLDN